MEQSRIPGVYKIYSNGCNGKTNLLDLECIKNPVGTFMLQRIVIRNIHSIDVCELDFAKGNYKFGEESILGNLVNPIIIYGHNGSGKTSFLNAIAHFILLLSAPAEGLSPFTVNNFLFEEHKADGKDETKIKGSVLLDFRIENDGYEYFLETSRRGYISSEYLKKNGEEFFVRTDKQCVFSGEKKEVSDAYRLVPLLRLLASSEIGNSTIQTVYSYLSSFVHVNVAMINRGGFVSSKLFMNANVYDLLVEKSNEVRSLLKEYEDFPVYSVVRDDRIAPNGLVNPQYSLILEDEGFKKSLPLQMASTGMLNQSILLSLLVSMPHDSVLFIDEADIALHPKALESFLRIVRLKKIQVVLSLHNTYAFQIIRPDQIYFAKWAKGFTHFYRLSKIYPNIREINNMEKMYLFSLFDDALEAHA